MKILIVDDHEIVRKGFKQVISRMKDMTISGEASTGEEAIQKIKKENFDVVVLDLSLPDKSGVEVLMEIKRIKPNLPILVFTIHSERQYAIQLIKAGASGYITKDAPTELIIQALHKISEGKKFITPSVAEEIANALEKGETRLPHELLSQRELVVLMGIYQGKSLKEIASQLFLSEKTISTYRYRILEKMGMHSNAELIRYVDKHNLFAK